VEQVTSDDTDELAALDMLLFPENCFNETTLAREIELGFCWGKWRQHALIAYVLVRYGEINDILRLGVHPDQQRRGIGSELLREVQNLGRPIVLTVRQGNLGALKLYLCNGFKVIGRLRDGLGWVLRYDPISW